MNTEIKIAIVLIIFSWLFIGVFSEPEFGDKTIFVKHKPTFKIEFYSPIGESDLKLSDLNKEKQIEEIAFQEYIINQNQLKSNFSQFFAILLIELIITYLTLGIYKLRNSSSYAFWQIIFQIIINILISTVGIALILTFYKLYISIIILTLIFVINYLGINLSEIMKRKINFKKDKKSYC